MTGLVVQDTATYWSYFGQLTILVLIQIGGLGVVTFAIATTLISGKKVNLKQRTTMQEAISSHKIGGIVVLTRFLIIATILFEVTGAILMAPVFIDDFGFIKGLWYSVFILFQLFAMLV